MRSAPFVKLAKPGVAVLVAMASLLPLAGCGDDTPTTPTETPTTTTVTFASHLAVGGSSTRSFEAPRSGTVSDPLISAGPTTSLRVGLGIGIPLTNGAGCVLSRSVEATPSTTAQLDLTVDAGNYCVQIYDPGTLTTVVPFSINVIYPA